MKCSTCGQDRAVTVGHEVVIAVGTKLERKVRWRECVSCWRKEGK